MKSVVLIVLSVLLLPLESPAQDQEAIDSISQVYQSAKVDTIRVKALLLITMATFLSNPDTAIIACEQALEIAKRSRLLYLVGLSRAE